VENEIVRAYENRTPLFPILFRVTHCWVAEIQMTATDQRDPSRVLYASAEQTNREPVNPNPHGTDVVLSFDVTSSSVLQLRITRLFVEVLEYIPIVSVEINPVMSAGETRRYFCNLGPSARI